MEVSMTKQDLVLISHALCPYVQRAAIALTEKGVPFARRDVDLGNKPDWFLEVSPLGKTPVLLVGGSPTLTRSVFESAVIVEYLEETQPNPMHPRDPLERAEHRSWIEFASAGLNDIAGFYNAPGAEGLETKRLALIQKFARLEARLADGAFFAGDRFSLVDAAFGPAFRYFHVFDRIADFGFLDDKPRTIAWRDALVRRPSVRAAVGPDYGGRLWSFLAARGSRLSALMAA